jgi:hypothetical protein
MPIEKINYKIKVNNSIMKSTLDITYLNKKDHNIEAVLELPTNPDIVISKMKIIMGDKVI